VDQPTPDPAAGRAQRRRRGHRPHRPLLHPADCAAGPPTLARLTAYGARNHHAILDSAWLQTTGAMLVTCSPLGSCTLPKPSPPVGWVTLLAATVVAVLRLLDSGLHQNSSCSSAVSVSGAGRSSPGPVTTDRCFGRLVAQVSAPPGGLPAWSGRPPAEQGVQRQPVPGPYRRVRRRLPANRDGHHQRRKMAARAMTVRLCAAVIRPRWTEADGSSTDRGSPLLAGVAA
jgi:hypothetical protein